MYVKITVWVLKFSISFNLDCPRKPGPQASNSCVCIFHNYATFLLWDPWSSELVLSWLPYSHFNGFPDPSGASASHSRCALQRTQLKLPAKHQPNCPTRWFMTLSPVFPPLHYCSCFGFTWATLPLFLWFFISLETCWFQVWDRKCPPLNVTSALGTGLIISWWKLFLWTPMALSHGTGHTHILKGSMNV